MSDLGRSSIVCLIRWLLIKKGFTEDDANAVIEKLRSEIIEVTAEKINDEGTRSALSQRLALHITRKAPPVGSGDRNRLISPHCRPRR